MAEVQPIHVAPTPALRRWSAEHGYAPELVARWAAFYPDVERLLEAMGRPVPTWIRLNGLRGDPRETIRRLRERGMELVEGPLPDAFEVRASEFSPGATPEYLAGRYFLQDLSSQLAPLALEPRPGETIVDLSAAPGGKTVAIADMMRNQGLLLAFEIDPDRHHALVANLARCGVACAASWARPGQDAAQLGIEADAVLLDAPCTGEGVVAKDPRRRMGQLQEYAACAKEQSSLLATAARILRPGGRLVYATCTLAPEENEFQVEYAVDELGLVPDPLPTVLEQGRLGGHPLAAPLAEAGGHRFSMSVTHARHALPHEHGCLGFFLARFHKED